MKYIEFKDAVVRAAEEKKLTDYELYYTESEDLSVEALMRSLDKFSTSLESGACFRCIYHGKMGYASTELFTKEEALRIVEDAMENAKVIESADKVFIHESGDSYHKVEQINTTKPEAKELVDAVLSLEESLYRLDERVQEGSEAFLGYGKTKVALCNSKGLDLSYEYDYSQIGAVVTVKEGEEVYNGYKIETGDFTQFKIKELGEEAVKKVTDKVGGTLVESGIYDLVFSGEMMAALLSTFFSSFSADAARRGLSLLKGKENTMIASEIVTIIDDPFYPDSYIKLPFDGEGVATYRKSIVEKGRLMTLLHNLTTAYEAGVKSTGNGRKMGYASTVSILPYNFFLEAGDGGNKEEIFEKVGKGIYITALNGLHAGANPASGDFSLSSEGFLIEEGKQSTPVKQFTVSGNFYELLKKITLVGSDMYLGNPSAGVCFGSPSVVVKEVSVAGK